MKMLNLVLITGRSWAARATRRGLSRRAGPASAPFGMGADKLMLVSQPSVRQELKLSDKQIKQLDQRREKQRAAFDELSDLEPEDAAKKIAKQAKSNDAAIGKILNAEQFKRVTEISLQQRGGLRLDRSRGGPIVDTHRRSEEQAPGRPGPIAGGNAKTLRAVRWSCKTGWPRSGRTGRPRPGRSGRSARSRAGDSRRTAAFEENFKKLDALRKSADEKMLVVLNEKQQTKWQSMQGEPFNGEIGPPNFRGGDRPEGPPPDGANGPPQRRPPPDDSR